MELWQNFEAHIFEYAGIGLYVLHAVGIRFENFGAQIFTSLPFPSSSPYPFPLSSLSFPCDYVISKL